MTLPCSVAANSSLICVPLVSFLYSTTKHASRLCFWKMLIHCFSIRNNFSVSLLHSLTIQTGCTCELTNTAQLVFQQNSGGHAFKKLSYSNTTPIMCNKAEPMCLFSAILEESLQFRFLPPCFIDQYGRLREEQGRQSLVIPRTSDLN